MLRALAFQGLESRVLGLGEVGIDPKMFVKPLWLEGLKRIVPPRR